MVVADFFLVKAIADVTDTAVVVVVAVAEAEIAVVVEADAGPEVVAEIGVALVVFVVLEPEPLVVSALVQHLLPAEAGL